MKRISLAIATALAVTIVTASSAGAKTFTDPSGTMSFAYPALPSLSVSNGAANVLARMLLSFKFLR